MLKVFKLDNTVMSLAFSVTLYVITLSIYFLFTIAVFHLYIVIFQLYYVTLPDITNKGKQGMKRTQIPWNKKILLRYFLVTRIKFVVLNDVHRMWRMYIRLLKSATKTNIYGVFFMVGLSLTLTCLNLFIFNMSPSIAYCRNWNITYTWRIIKVSKN